MKKYTHLLTVLFISGQIFLSLLVSSCSLHRAAADIKEIKKSKTLKISVKENKFEGQILCAVYSSGINENLLAFKVIKPEIPKTAFILQKGLYKVVVHYDKNSNLIIDKDEKTDIYTERFRYFDSSRLLK